VSAKRNEQEEGASGSGSSANLAAASHTLRTADEAAKAAAAGSRSEEQMSMFWRVFGGTILSICALVGVTVFNNISTSIAELRADLSKAQEARAKLADDLRTEIAHTKEGRAEYAKKDELQTRMTSVWDRMAAVQAQGTAHTSALTAQKTELDALKEKWSKSCADADLARKELTAALDAARKDSATATDSLRKDLSATVDAVKKEVAFLELVKERLAVLSADLKAAQADFAKVRQELDKNQAYDIERKAFRDSQYTRIDEVLKELQKSVQECREKMARLEATAAVGTPPSAPEPKPTKKAPVEAVPTSNPRPAPVEPPGAPKPGPEALDGTEPPKPAPGAPTDGDPPARD
jgi:DNA repair exonuclease SbcCD ATPase subunit